MICLKPSSWLASQKVDKNVQLHGRSPYGERGLKYASERPHDCHDRRSPYGKRGLKSTGAGARRRSGVFLQVGIHSIGTIFQLHRRLVSNRNCSVGTRRPFSWLSGHEGVLAAVGASLESDEPAVAHGAVDQRGGHVLVAEHASPAGELDVRGVDHGSARRFAHLGSCPSMGR